MIALSFASDIAGFFAEIVGLLRLTVQSIGTSFQALINILPITANILTLKTYFYSCLPAAVVIVFDLAIVLAIVNIFFRGFGSG